MPRGDSYGPAIGENVRVLKWILERIEGKGSAVETPIGFLPSPGALTLDGLNISHASRWKICFAWIPLDWAEEHAAIGQFFETFGARLPQELLDEHAQLGERLGRMAARPPLVPRHFSPIGNRVRTVAPSANL